MAGVLVIAEHRQGRFSDITREAIGAAVALKADVGGPVSVLVVHPEPAEAAAALNLLGVDEIITVAAATAGFDPHFHEEVAARMVEERRPRCVLLGHTADGMVLGPGLAVRLGSGFASDVFALDVRGDEIVATRGGHGGKVDIALAFPGKCLAVLMLRGASFPAPDAPGQAAVIDLPPPETPPVWRHLDYFEPELGGVDIATADFILSIGRGIQDEENVARFAALAERLGATLGCSRPVADSGWLHKAHQVGLTGKVAANCKLYMALGISGAVQHLHGMKHVETIIAVNTDANAPIFNVATYGVCMDLFDFAAALERQFN